MYKDIIATIIGVLIVLLTIILILYLPDSGGENGSSVIGGAFLFCSLLIFLAESGEFDTLDYYFFTIAFIGLTGICLVVVAIWILDVYPQNKSSFNLLFATICTTPIVLLIFRTLFPFIQDSSLQIKLRKIIIITTHCLSLITVFYIGYLDIDSYISGRHELSSRISPILSFFTFFIVSPFIYILNTIYIKNSFFSNIGGLDDAIFFLRSFNISYKKETEVIKTLKTKYTEIYRVGNPHLLINRNPHCITIFLQSNDWKAEVRKMITKSKYIFVLISSSNSNPKQINDNNYFITEGLLWEALSNYDQVEKFIYYIDDFDRFDICKVKESHNLQNHQLFLAIESINKEIIKHKVQRPSCCSFIIANNTIIYSFDLMSLIDHINYDINPYVYECYLYSNSFESENETAQKKDTRKNITLQCSSQSRNDTSPSLFFTLKHVQKEINSAEFSPSGKYILTTQDKSINCWDIQKGDLLYTLKENTRFAHFSPDGNTFLTSSYPKEKIKIWDTESGRILKVFNKQDNGTNISAFFNPNGNSVLSTSWDDFIYLWDIESCKIIRKIKVHNPVYASFSPDGKTIISIDSSYIVRLFDSSTGKIKQELHTSKWRSLTRIGPVFFSPDGNLILTVVFSQIHLYDSKTSNLINSFSIDHNYSFIFASFSPDSKKIVAATDDNSRQIIVWNIEEGSEHIIGSHKSIKMVQFNHDGTQIISCGDDYNVKIWNIN